MEIVHFQIGETCITKLLLQPHHIFQVGFFPCQKCLEVIPLVPPNLSVFYLHHFDSIPAQPPKKPEMCPACISDCEHISKRWPINLGWHGLWHPWKCNHWLAFVGGCGWSSYKENSKIVSWFSNSPSKMDTKEPKACHIGACHWTITLFGDRIQSMLPDGFFGWILWIVKGSCEWWCSWKRSNFLFSTRFPDSTAINEVMIAEPITSPKARKQKQISRFPRHCNQHD